MQHRPRHRERGNMKTENDKMNRREKPCAGREPKSSLLRPRQSKVKTERSKNSLQEVGPKKERRT